MSNGFYSVANQKACRFNISVCRALHYATRWYTLRLARVAELVDAHGSGPCIARCGDSSSLPGTIKLPIQQAARHIKCLSGFILFKSVLQLKRDANQIVSLNAHNPSLGEFAYF